MKNIAVIVAGGNSTRCRFDKLFTADFGDPLLVKTISVFQFSEVIDDIVIILSAKNFAKGHSLQSRFSKISKILLGGDTRYESVKNAIEYLNIKESKNAQIIVHNGANPYLSMDDLKRGIVLAKEKKNVIFGYFTPNSMKKVVDNQVVSFLNRTEIFETQTPQISDLKTFVKATKVIETGNCTSFNGDPKDEAELLTLVNEDIFIYECDPENKKITYASDFREIRNKKMRVDDSFRIGVGEDSHRFMKHFKPQKPLVIGGISFPESKKTFDSNSDGDVILHSLCNAILSAVGEKTFDTFASSMCKSGITNSQKYLEKTMEIVRDKYPEFKIINVVFSLEGMHPKLAPRHDELILNLKKILNISNKKIGLTYTSGEELSSYGKGLGVKCLCNILVHTNYT